MVSVLPNLPSPYCGLQAEAGLFVPYSPEALSHFTAESLQFANPGLGRLYSEQGQPSQTGSLEGSIVHSPGSPMAGFALEYASKVPGISVMSKLVPKDPFCLFPTEPETMP